MWLEKKKYQEIRTALHSGARPALDRVLHEIAAEEKSLLKTPGRCPVCHKELKRGPLPYLEFIGAACPDYHGWWLSPEISKKLCDSIGEQISIGVKKARQFKMLAALLAAGVGLFFLSNLLSKAELRSPSPAVVFLLPMPAQSAAVSSGEEWQYLLNAARILENAMVNRLVFERSLKSRLSEEERWKAFGFYRASAETLIEKLKTIPVPPKAGAFHDSLIHALQNQIVYFALKSEGKEQASSANALQQGVAKSLELLLKIYPALDPQTRQALQERLFSLEGE